MSIPSETIERDPFSSYSAYLRRKYGVRAYRVSVDAGFGCPHRNHGRGSGGCAFCDEYGSRAAYSRSSPCDDIETQVRNGLRFLRARYDAEVFLLYFQAYTNTDAPVPELRRVYDSGLRLAPFRELIVSTRPDAVDEEKADLLAGYARDDFDVWVELGLQSAHDDTLDAIRRGHDVATFDRSFRMLRERDIKMTIHLIFGLPGEGWNEIEETIRYVASLKPDGIKIHNLQIPVSSVLQADYRRGEVTVPCGRRHLGYVIGALELLPAETVVMRVTSDFSPHRVVAPRNFMPKGTFYQRLRGEMLKRHTFQGRLYAI